MARELLARVLGELPMVAGLGEREQLLAAAWLTSLRSLRTGASQPSGQAVPFCYLVPGGEAAGVNFVGGRLAH